ncbi:ankyrin repeat domain-containing protein [uncultured Castellaniella sp.]|uniref:ankyrin repeat domain-containing protein n=1 Tax=uncultured Castellaniella sp. TaxID=647907 RepID=UPI0026038555|nr:ankyrin repeat domain-containing protein [uncultured Castellaniella sp.]
MRSDCKIALSGVPGAFGRIIPPSSGRATGPWLAAFLLAGLLWAFAAQAQRAPTADWWSAIRRDDVSAVQDMLLRGVDPNAMNSLGNPALTQAARDQSWRVFDVLRIAPGVKVDLPNAHDETALMYLCILGQNERAAGLIQAGAQVNRLGWTPLHYAASKGQVETARLLIDWGAIVNAPGPDGTTPLMMAALSGKPAIVKLLLSQGADPTMFNTARETAADWALKRNHKALAEQLTAVAEQVAQRREQGRAAGPRGAQASPVAPDAPNRDAPAQSAAPTAQAPAKPGQPEGEDDKSSFSRYFDLGRFEDAPAGR